MSAIDAVSRIQDIQATLLALRGERGATGAGSAGATAFADALSGATTDRAAGATGPAPTGAGDAGSAIVADARRYLGVPYVFAGEDESGMDCSGLVQRVLEDLGATGVPRLVQGQATIGEEVPSLAQAQPGDLISIDGNSHIVIYAGENKVIHAPRPGKVVSEVPVWFDDSRIVSIRRVPADYVPGVAAADASGAGARSTAATASAASAASITAASSMTSALTALTGSGTTSWTSPSSMMDLAYRQLIGDVA
jgi:peptidoglycan DL-endopeptidase CwlO